MSKMAIRVEQSNGEIGGGAEFRNSHGFQPFVWRQLVEKYDVQGGVFKAWQQLWEDTQNGKIELQPWESNVLMATYDRALVKREDIPVLSASFRRFADVFDNGKKGVCHLRGIATAMDAHSEEGRDCVAIGFHGTSLSDDLLGAKYVKEDEEYRAYNTNVDEGHWYAEILNIEGQQGV